MESHRRYGSILVQTICFAFFRSIIEDHFLCKMFPNMLFVCRLVKHAAELCLVRGECFEGECYKVLMKYPKVNPS